MSTTTEILNPQGNRGPTRDLKMRKETKEKEVKEQPESRFKLYLLVSVPIAGILTVGIIVDFPALYAIVTGRTIYIRYLSDLTYPEMLNIIFTFALVEFAGLEGYSTYVQLVMEERRNRIGDARDELEKAYGPLYSLLNSLAVRYSMGNGKPTNVVGATEPQKERLDSILATYPFMFPTDIYEYWTKNVQPAQLIPSLYDQRKEIPVFNIPTEFRDKINREYHHRVERYNRLLGKDKA
jgi:hypothetical protein